MFEVRLTQDVGEEQLPHPLPEAEWSLWQNVARLQRETVRLRQGCEPMLKEGWTLEEPFKQQ